MNAFSIGQSALSAGQQALDVIGQNVANANTANYSRQEISLVPQTIGSQNDGVEVAQVTRAAATAVQGSILQSNSESSLISTRLSTQQQAQSFVSPGTGDIGSQLSSLFSNVAQLTSNPNSLTQQSVVVTSASALAQEFNQVSTSLDQQRASLGTQVQQAVTQINQLTPQIATLNEQIAGAESDGQQPNSLLDQRDALVNQLSNLTDVQVSQSDGSVNIIGGNVPLVVGTFSDTLVATTGAGGNISIAGSSSGLAATPTGGTLGGLLEDNNVSLPGYQSQLDTLAQSVMRQLDSIQATGLSSSGPFTSLTGSRGVLNQTATLASQNLPIPAQAGTLYISVTNTASGQRTLNPIAIDPSTQSIQDVASAITAGTGGQVQASVNATTGQLQLQAQSGYKFDFAGQVPSQVPTASLNGTTTPQVTGTYSGASNDNFSFQVLGSGTIGTTSGLQLQVTNSANSVVATVNVGSGYTPGSAISIGYGLNVSLSAGTSNNGTFSTPVVANPDTSGILATLGVNSLFSGTGASNIAVNSAVAANPALLSTSRSGQPGDSSNLQRMAAVQNATALSGGTQTLAGYFSQVVGSVGSTVSGLTDQQSAQTTLAHNLQTQAQSISGVDINQQMLQMLSYQQMMESTSKYLSVVNSTLQSVINIIQ